MGAVHRGTNDGPFGVRGDRDRVPLDVGERGEKRAEVFGEFVRHSEALVEGGEVLDATRLPQGNHRIDVVGVCRRKISFCYFSDVVLRFHNAVRLLAAPPGRRCAPEPSPSAEKAVAR